MGKKVQRNYPEDFKRGAVSLVESGRSVASVSAELGISASVLHRWRKEGFGAAPRSKSLDLEEENRSLRRELNQTRQERDLLKKSIALFVKTGS